MPLPVASKAYVDFYKLQYLVRLPLLEEKSRGYCNLKKNWSKSELQSLNGIF